MNNVLSLTRVYIPAFILALIIITLSLALIFMNKVFWKSTVRSTNKKLLCMHIIALGILILALYFICAKDSMVIVVCYDTCIFLVTLSMDGMMVLLLRRAQEYPSPEERIIMQPSNRKAEEHHQSSSFDDCAS